MIRYISKDIGEKFPISGYGAAAADALSKQCKMGREKANLHFHLLHSMHFKTSISSLNLPGGQNL